jgi:hypothetical protein
MIAAALSFNSGILLVADADPSGNGTSHDNKKIYPRQYGEAPACARSVFVVSDAVEWAAAAFARCEQALEAVPTDARTIDRMRDAVQGALFESYRERIDRPSPVPELTGFVALYSPIDHGYALYHTLDTTIREVAGHDCVGGAAYLGHYLIRDRYNAARSMDALNLETVFSIATDTVEGVRSCHGTCGTSSDMVVMYADGHVSEIQRIPQDTHKQRKVALAALART